MKKIYSSIISLMLISLLASVTFAQTSEQTTKLRNYFSFPEHIKEGDYQEKTVVLKVKQQFSDVSSLTYLNNYLSELGLEQPLKRKFPHAEKPQREYNDFGLKYADLTRIYQFTYKANILLENVINTIYSMNIAEYAEPNYIMKPHYTVNDPSVGQQWHISKIKCPQAWDVNKGDTNVVIGIVDSEIQWDHSDLTGNIKLNYADPIDGIDNDGDGYVDNYRGYDLGEGDSDTRGTTNFHGTHVSGCASPSTDNGTGVAGPGFKCRLLPVKIANSSGSLIAGYEGIAYAADHGAKVINCSWGSPGGGAAGQDVIDYATINKDVLVLASAGNDANEVELFPAAYTYAISVAATTSLDKRSSFSSYGTWVDISSPGSTIYATWPTNTYSSLDGTSMASPIAAGGAALIRSQFSFMNALQAGEQLRVTCDPMPTESQYNAGKMGNGRINLFAAVSGLTSPSIAMIQKDVQSSSSDPCYPSDTILIRGTFVNYLLAAGNVTATLTTSTPSYVTLLDSVTALGAMGTMASANNNADPFVVLVKPGVPVNAIAKFLITITDGSYTKKEYLNVTINVDYINVAVNEIATSITSKSLTGFNDFSTQLEGIGFRYIPGDAQNLLFDGGLMVGVSGKVSDNCRNTGGVDSDFSSKVRIQKLQNLVSDFDVEGVFHDSLLGVGAVPVSVHHKGYAWNKPGHTRYVMVEYTITNTGTSTLNGMYAGIYTDWDINMGQSNGYANNSASTDTARHLGYTFNVQTGGLYAGVQVVSANAPFYHYAMDNNAGQSGVHPNVSYTSADKYTTLSTMKTDAGNPVQDVSNVVSTGPFNLAAGDSVTVAFALLGGDNLADLLKTADSAMVNYPGYKPSVPCTAPVISATITTFIKSDCGQSNGSVTVDGSGGVSPYTYEWSNGQSGATAINLAAGNYSVTITDNNQNFGILDVTVTNPDGPLSSAIPVDATAIGACDGSATVSASGGTSPYTYLWSDANGQTTLTATGLCAGNYSVTVTDSTNCTSVTTVVVSEATSVNYIKDSNPGFRIYPNPATGIATIYFALKPSERNAKVSIFNLLGEEIEQIPIKNQLPVIVDVSSFESGIYFCHLKTSEGIFTKKMTVVK